MIGTEAFAFQIAGMRPRRKSYLALRGLSLGAVGVGCDACTECRLLSAPFGRWAACAGGLMGGEAGASDPDQSNGKPESTSRQLPPTPSKLGRYVDL